MTEPYLLQTLLPALSGHSSPRRVLRTLPAEVTRYHLGDCFCSSESAVGHAVETADTAWTQSFLEPPQRMKPPGLPIPRLMVFFKNYVLISGVSVLRQSN